jgi:hypothetical protein
MYLRKFQVRKNLLVRKSKKIYGPQIATFVEDPQIY